MKGCLMAEDKRKKTITVKEIKELAPLADVYELNEFCKYLVRIPKSELVGGNELAHRKAKVVANALQALNIPCIVIIGVAEDVTFLELKGEKV